MFKKENIQYLGIKFKILCSKNNRIWNDDFSFEQLKQKFSISSNINLQQLITFLNNKNLTIAISCDNKDIFLQHLEKYTISQIKDNNGCSINITNKEFKLKLLDEINSYNSFLLNVNFNEDCLFQNFKKCIFPFSKKDIVELKRKIRSKYISSYRM